MVRRLLQLYVGLGLYGLSTAMFIRSDLGVDPWDVFHLGVGMQLGMTIGTVIIVTGAAVLLLWIPLRQMPGLGTISNVICIGLAADASMALIPELDSLAVRIAFLVSGIVMNAIATSMYIGAGFGPGPRDGLMTGVVRRSGWKIWQVRSGIESELATKIQRLIKDSKMKVQASIQGDTVRVSGAKRDDLQAAMALLKKTVTEAPLSFNNFRD